MADAMQSFVLSLAPGYGFGPIWYFPVNLGPSIVRRILLTWPAGCGGRVFIGINAGGESAFPVVPGTFLAFDDYTYSFDVSNQINNGNWTIRSRNNDSIEHDPIIVFEYDYLRGIPTHASYTPIPL